MTRLPLEGYREHCETRTVIGGGRPELVSEPLELDIPVYLTSMSFGALGANAKRALGMGFSRAGLATCTGEGGMLPEEREASRRLIYQMTPSRYGLDLDHLRRRDGIEIVIGQGAKPGTGGLLLGMKISDKVAEMRTLPVGVDQRSAVRHPDFLGGDDLAVKIEELREATDYQVPIILKLAACRVEQDVKIAAKTGCDAIVVDGTEGATAAIAGVPAGPLRRPDAGGDPRRPPRARGHRHVRQDHADRLRRHPERRRRGQGVRARRRLRRDRHRRADGGGLQRAELRQRRRRHRRLRRARHRRRCLSPLPHRPLPGRRDDAGPRARGAPRPRAGAERVHNFLTSMYKEMTILAKSCGKRDVHNLEPEDLRALTLEASAFTGVPLVGVDWMVTPGTFGG